MAINRTATHMTIVESERRPASGESEPYAIELRDIVKRFPGVVANDGVNLKVRAARSTPSSARTAPASRR